MLIGMLPPDHTTPLLFGIAAVILWGTIFWHLRKGADPKAEWGFFQGKARPWTLFATGILASVCSFVAFATYFFPPVARVGTATKRLELAGNLRELSRCFHLYQQDHGSFPAAVFYGPTGQPYSWRIAILPQLGEADLYRQYNQQEPWDSPGNLAVMKKMPKVFHNPFDESKSTATHYQVLTGPGTIFERGKAMSVSEIKDDPDRTLLIVVSSNPVPWTKPQDLDYDPGKPVPPLGIPQCNGACYAAFADGSVRIVLYDLPEERLRAVITASGGEPARPEDP
jgi:hypothetical protein